MAIMVGSNNQQMLFACGRRGRSSAADSRIRVTAESGSFKVNTPYNASFVAMLKDQVPATARKWDMASKCWYVGRDYAAQLKTIIDAAYGSDVVLPNIIAEKSVSQEITFKAEYVANCKQDAASVYTGGGWNARIPEKVLRAWFKQADANAENASFYGLLGLDETCAGDEIKRAYKRAARQWHPDLCKEDNAREMFEKIKSAFDILSNPISRNKYNAGLIFERMSRQPNQRQTKFTSFTPMLRCGELKVKGYTDLGMLIVEEILEWNDIENAIGQTMVSFWNGDSFAAMWV